MKSPKKVAVTDTEKPVLKKPAAASALLKKDPEPSEPKKTKTVTFNDVEEVKEDKEESQSPVHEDRSRNVDDLALGEKKFTTDSFKTDNEHISEVDEDGETKSEGGNLAVSNSITNLEIDNVLNRVSPVKTSEQKEGEGEEEGDS